MFAVIMNEGWELTEDKLVIDAFARLKTMKVLE
jgi:hypothetical protein